MRSPHSSHGSGRATRGFSLVELVLVMSILALLAGVVAPRLSNQLRAARDARRLADVQAVRRALDQYFEDHREYPPGDDSGGNGGWDVSHDGSFISTLVETGYLEGPVDDPVGDEVYHYRYYRYAQGSYDCVGPGAFYVLGIRNFETEAYAAKHGATFSCDQRDWGTEFDWVAAGGASLR